MKHALISVHDKTGLIDFARGLTAHDYKIIASGGTASALHAAGIAVAPVEALTGLPSILGGRVKTLHPAIFGGILARDTAEDRATLDAYGWPPIDLVAVSLYPFAETIARPGVTLAEAIEQIDIGGVSLIRAAAKNHARVAVVSDPSDYAILLQELDDSGEISADTRRKLAATAFIITSTYDAAIAEYMMNELVPGSSLPIDLILGLTNAHYLRYGENSHQQAALYTPAGIGPLGGELLQGKTLSYNNLLDADAAWSAAADFDTPAVVIVKHLSPCGIAVAESLTAAFERALASDPISAFGGVIACTRPVDESFAAALGDLFVEVIAAPDFTAGALAALSTRKNLRLLKLSDAPDLPYRLRSVRAGVLLQTPDAVHSTDWQVVTSRPPTEAELADLRFAWIAVKHVKSNAIVFARGGATVGIGGGLTSRVDAVELAAKKAGDRAQGAVMASDAFFPFPDGLEAAAAAGITAVVQPGGSVRDADVIAAANRINVAMVFTGIRHFKH